jgi:hypothetical protein
MIIRGNREAKYCGVANFEDNLNKYLENDINVINYPCDRWSSLIDFIFTFLKSYALLKNLTLILHEYKNFRVKKYLLKLLCTFPRLKIVVSSELEKKTLNLKKVFVIDIPSNIHTYHELKETKLRSYDFVYFGQIAPNKGIEAYINLKKICSSKHKFIFIGAERKDQKVYSDVIKKEFNKNGIKYYLNLAEEDISYYLSNSKYAFYLLPNGIENKSGSVKACLEHGVIVFGNLNKDISSEIKDAIIPVNTTNELNQKLITQINEVKNLKFNKIDFRKYADFLKKINLKDKNEFF